MAYTKPIQFYRRSPYPQLPESQRIWLEEELKKLERTTESYDGALGDLEQFSQGIPDNAITPAKMANSGYELGSRNRIINGAFLINQRSVSGTVTLTAGSYGHDRWKAGASGCTYTFATSNGLTTITITSGSLQQVIEDRNVPTGTNTVVMSWSGTAQGKIASGSYGASGITASVTGGSNLTVEFGTGTLTNVQLELGSTPTPFEYRMGELQLCQRYFWRSDTTSTAYEYLGTGTVWSGTAAYTPFRLPVQMRASPTCTYTGSAGLVQMVMNGGAVNAMSVTLAEPTPQSFRIDLTSSGLPVGYACVVRVALSSGLGYFNASAEL